MGKYDGAADESLALRKALLAGRELLLRYVAVHADAFEIEALDVAAALRRGRVLPVGGVWTLCMYHGLHEDTVWELGDRGVWAPHGPGRRLTLAASVADGDIQRIKEFVGPDGRLIPGARVPTNFEALFVQDDRLIISRRSSLPGVPLEEALRAAVQELVLGR